METHTHMNKRVAGTLLYTGHRVITDRKGKKFTFPFATLWCSVYYLHNTDIQTLHDTDFTDSRVLTNHYRHNYRLPKGIVVLPGGYRSFLDRTHKPSA